MVTNSQHHIHETRIPAWDRDAWRKAGQGNRSMLRKLADMLQRRRQRARLRRELERLDDHMLHDIGARRAELEAEAAKPFWRR